MKRTTRYLLGGVLAGGIFAADRIAKSAVKKHVPEGKRMLLSPKTGRLVEVNHVRNYGMARNAGESDPAAVRRLTTALTAGAGALFAAKPGPSTGLLLGGAAGNLLDRWQDGYVTDYLSFDLGDPELKDLSFNVADFGIFAGAGGLAAGAALSDLHRQARREYAASHDGEAPSAGRTALLAVQSVIRLPSRRNHRSHRTLKGFADFLQRRD